MSMCLFVRVFVCLAAFSGVAVRRFARLFGCLRVCAFVLLPRRVCTFFVYLPVCVFDCLIDCLFACSFA